MRTKKVEVKDEIKTVTVEEQLKELRAEMFLIVRQNEQLDAQYGKAKNELKEAMNNLLQQESVLINGESGNAQTE